MTDFSKETLLLIVYSLFLVCHAAQYWVRSNTTVDCPTGVPMERCVTLVDIAANNSKYFVSNTQINFLTGIHFITSDTGIWVGTEGYDYPWPYLHNITLIGEHTDGAIIHCKGTQVGFSFLDVENFTFSRLSITQCGFNIANIKYQGIKNRLQQLVYASVVLQDLKHLTLRNVVIQNSTGIGLLALRLDGNMKIESSVFQYNTEHTLISHGKEVYLSGGNAYIEVWTGITLGRYPNVTISNCQFLHGKFGVKQNFYNIEYESSYLYKRSAGLTLDLDQNVLTIIN